MNNSKKWEVLSNFKFPISNSQKESTDEIKKLIDVLLGNRGLQTKKEKDAFLHPQLESVTTSSVGIDAKGLKKTLTRIEKAIQENEQIVVYGDYDVDGITGTAILWETLNSLGAKVTPYIPSRIDEGYGLSEKGIENLLIQFPTTKLIITVDNGIVANTAVDIANAKKIDVIITDHHTVGKTLPDAFSIVHTTQVCGAGVAYFLSEEVQKRYKIQDTKYQIPGDHLALVALATVADLVSLTGANRVLLTFGLEVLRQTKRPGIIELCKNSGIEQKDIDVYVIGHMLSPRLNAMGRIASAMDSLRLICTRDSMRAKALAEKLGLTNTERQFLTKSLSDHAILAAVAKKGNVLFIAHETYDEGVIGLIAGKLVEKYYRPSIVLSIGKTTSKASARSVAGFNIIEFIRSASHLLINAGGHPMAAGFTIHTEKIQELQKFLEESSKDFDKALLTRTVKIDCVLPIENISQQLFDELQRLQPFGMGNFEPTFVSTVTIADMKLVGKDRQHVSFQFTPVYSSSEQRESRSKTDSSRPGSNNNILYGIAFGMGEKVSELSKGEDVQVVYTISENAWREKKSLQLKIKDIKAIAS